MFLLIVGNHFWLLWHLPKCVNFINETSALAAQIIGGLLVLYSIDSTIGVIKKQTLLSMFVSYLKEFPLFKRSIIMAAAGISLGTATGRARGSVARKPTTIEEQISYLQEQIDHLKMEFDNELKEANDKMDRLFAETHTRIQQTANELRSLESKMDEVSAGGIKVQFFGVLLLLYSAITSYVA